MCLQVKRIHRDEITPICKACYSKVTPCARCDRIGRPVGRIESFGLLCNSCARNFAPTGICSVCSASGIVSAARKYGIEHPICNNCRNKLYQKCPQCGTKSALYKCADGVHKCYRCRDKVKFYCYDCGRAMTGHKRTYCQFCRSVDLNNIRKSLNCARFRDPEKEKLFANFVDWLEANVGPIKSAQSQHRFVELFVALQGAPHNWFDDEYFLANFDGGFFRVSSLVRRYFSSIGISFDPVILENSMHLRTIQKNLRLIENVASTEHFDLVSSYFKSRVNDSQKSKITLQTIRIESTAVRLFTATLHSSNNIIQALRTYSAESPGHLNALSKFLTFMGVALRVRVEIPKNTHALRLAFLVRKNQKTPLPEKFIREYLSLALLTLHSVEITKQGELSYQKVDDGYRVNVGQHSYWLPNPS